MSENVTTEYTEKELDMLVGKAAIVGGAVTLASVSGFVAGYVINRSVINWFIKRRA